MNRSPAKTSPERTAWLRKHHKEPMRDRAADVLGECSKVVLPQLMALPDATARQILRAAVKAIPDQDYGRRRHYVATCLEKPQRDAAAKEAELILSNLDADDWRNLDEVEQGELKAITAALPDDRDYLMPALRKRVGERLAMQLWNLCVKRGDPEAFGRICKNVCSAKYPSRYVRVVIEELKSKSGRKSSAKMGKVIRSGIDQREQITDEGIPDESSPD